MSRRRNLLNFLSAFGVLMLCAAGYQGLFSWLHDHPRNEQLTLRQAGPHISLDERTAALFPEGSWQRGNCSRMLTKNGILLYQDWKKSEQKEDAWRLFPMTLIIGHGLEGTSASPIVMTADEGAEIQFSGKITRLGRGDSGAPIKWARLDGNVHVYRPGDVPLKDQLDLVTKGVRIDKNEISTQNAIDLRIGGAHLKGRDLSIELTSSASNFAGGKLGGPQETDSGQSKAAFLSKLTLIYLDELRIPLNPGTSADDYPRSVQRVPSANIGRPNRIGRTTAPLRIDSTGGPSDSTAQQQLLASMSRKNPDGSPDQGIVILKADERLVYDFAINQLSLRSKQRKVELIREINGTRVDVARFEVLDLTLNQPANQSLVRKSELDWINRIDATGAEVFLGSQGGLEIVAQELNFDRNNGLLTVLGRDWVTVANDLFHATLQNITYKYNPEQPDVLGTVSVGGAGRVEIKDPEKMVSVVQWSKLLSLGGYADEPVSISHFTEKIASGAVGFNIAGDVTAKLSDGGTIETPSLVGRLVPKRVIKPAPTASQKDKVTLTWVPQQLEAPAGIQIDSPLALASANNVKLFFETSADFGQPISDASSQESAQQRRDFERLAVRQPDTPTTRPVSMREPVARPRPIVRGQSLVANLLLTPDGLQAKNVQVTGDITVEHQVGKQQDLPIRLKGQYLAIEMADVMQSSGQDRIILVGSANEACRLDMEDGYFIGPKIEVLPSDNIVKVTGAGQLKVPRSLLENFKLKSMLPATAANPGTTVATNTVPPNNQTGTDTSVQFLKTPECRWSNSLYFDGKRVTLDGGVNLECVFEGEKGPWSAALFGEQMQIDLAQPLDLMDKASFATAAVDRVLMQRSENQQVMIQAQQVDQALSRGSEPLVSDRHAIACNQLVLTPNDGGQLVGIGPGWHRSWLLTRRDRSLIPKNPNAGAANLGPYMWLGNHLTFRDQLAVSVGRQQAGFSGGVRIGMRPLESGQDNVDVAQMDRLARGELLIDCEKLRMALSPNPNPGQLPNRPRVGSAPPPWELVADGGVNFRHLHETEGLLEISAARASFESLKSTFSLESSGAQSVTLQQTLPDGTPGTRGSFRNLQVNTNGEMKTQIRDVQVSAAPEFRSNN